MYVCIADVHIADVHSILSQSITVRILAMLVEIPNLTDIFLYSEQVCILNMAQWLEHLLNVQHLTYLLSYLSIPGTRDN